MAFAIPLAAAAFPETFAGLAGAAGFATQAGTMAAGSSFLSGLGAVATGISAISSISQGRAQANAAKYNAAVQSNNAQLAERNATLAGQEGAANTAIEQQKTRAGVASIKASQAANGVDVNTGSAVDVRSSAAELGELNAITVRSNAARQAYGYQTQASSDRAQAQLDRQEASYDSKAGYIKAGSTLLGNATTGNQSGLWDSFLEQSSL